MGNRLSVTASLPGAPAGYSGTTAYAYDYGQSANPQLNRSQLTQETSTRASGTFAYGYDGGTSGGPGNPTSFKGAANTFNSNNQVTNAGFGYDGNGSPTTYKTQAMSFDPENRLSAFTPIGGGKGGNVFDGDGLLQETDTQGFRLHSTDRLRRLYDGSAPVALYKQSSNQPASALPSATQTFGADGLVSVCSPSAAASVFYAFDERGNVAQRLNSSGAVVSSDEYDAYGTRSSTGGADVYGFGAQAGYYTDSSGLVLCTHRYYDPSTGRWLTRDPIGYRGGVNLYGYVRNNPTRHHDHSGYGPGDFFSDSGGDYDTQGFDPGSAGGGNFFDDSGPFPTDGFDPGSAGGGDFANNGGGGSNQGGGSCSKKPSCEDLERRGYTKRDAGQAMRDAGYSGYTKRTQGPMRDGSGGTHYTYNVPGGGVVTVVCIPCNGNGKRCRVTGGRH